MKKNIRNLINRLRSYQGCQVYASDPLVGIVSDCIEAANALDEAYDYIDSLPRISQSGTGMEVVLPYDISELSESDVEPDNELFEYFYTNSPWDDRTVGVIKAADLNEASKILKNNVGPYCRITHIQKLEFNDAGNRDIYCDS